MFGARTTVCLMIPIIEIKNIKIETNLRNELKTILSSFLRMLICIGFRILKWRCLTCSCIKHRQIEFLNSRLKIITLSMIVRLKSCIVKKCNVKNYRDWRLKKIKKRP